MSLSHISLNVRDLQRTTDFWLRVLEPLGYQLADGEAGDYQRITNGRDLVITFGQVAPERVRIPFSQDEIGLYHIAFLAESRQQVDQMATYLKSLNIPLVEPGIGYMEYRGGYYSLAFEDPNGFEIEIAFHGSQYFEPGDL